MVSVQLSPVSTSHASSSSRSVEMQSSSTPFNETVVLSTPLSKTPEKSPLGSREVKVQIGSDQSVIKGIAWGVLGFSLLTPGLGLAVATAGTAGAMGLAFVSGAADAAVGFVALTALSGTAALGTLYVSGKSLQNCLYHFMPGQHTVTIKG